MQLKYVNSNWHLILGVKENKIKGFLFYATTNTYIAINYYYYYIFLFSSY